MGMTKCPHGVRKKCEWCQYWHVVEKRCLYEEIRVQAEAIARMQDSIRLSIERLRRRR